MLRSLQSPLHFVKSFGIQNRFMGRKKFAVVIFSNGAKQIITDPDIHTDEVAKETAIQNIASATGLPVEKIVPVKDVIWMEDCPEEFDKIFKESWKDYLA